MGTAVQGHIERRPVDCEKILLVIFPKNPPKQKISKSYCSWLLTVHHSVTETLLFASTSLRGEGSLVEVNRRSTDLKK